MLRWHSLSDDSLWKELTNVYGPGTVETNDTVWQGMYMGDGQTLFYASAVDAPLFAHEMGHSLNLAHFVAEDVSWKHHHLGSPDRLMSYDYTEGHIWKPAGGTVGPVHGAPVVSADPWPIAYGGTDVEHGWPHRDNDGANDVDCIRYGTGIAPGQFCAKCLLKLRGWNDEKLPSSWTHPDLFQVCDRFQARLCPIPTHSAVRSASVDLSLEWATTEFAETLHDTFDRSVC